MIFGDEILEEKCAENEDRLFIKTDLKTLILEILRKLTPNSFHTRQIFIITNPLKNF